jgi:hypothetical protein
VDAGRFLGSGLRIFSTVRTVENILRGYAEGTLGISKGTLKEFCGTKWYILEDYSYSVA